MASTSPIRRPLGALSTNAAPIPNSSFGLAKKLSSPNKSINYLGASPCAAQSQETLPLDSVLSTPKRQSPDYVISAESNKRRKMSVTLDAEIPKENTSVCAQSEEEPLLSSQAEVNIAAQLSHLTSPSRSASPASVEDTETSIIMANKDSQNTTITVPDEDVVAEWHSSPRPTTTSHPLTPEEIRQKAKDIRLRLTLANYKVKTNQINIPISRLQICSSASSTSHTRSHSAHAHPSPQAPRVLTRTPLPSTSIPNISVQHPSAEKSPQPRRLFSALPVETQAPDVTRGRYPLLSPVKQGGILDGSSNSSAGEGAPTALLSKQREGMSNPPSLERPDEVNSVVKSHAADGLLSLMHQS